MNHHYSDITDRLGVPLWYDEHAVPRYCAFAPDECANIYAREAVLLRIVCQNCGQPFAVAMTISTLDMARGARSLEDRVRADEIHYGDPPNANCCPAGPVMNSVPRQVLQFWQRETSEWSRRKDLEIPLSPVWDE